MLVQRAPRAALRPIVKTLWATDASPAPRTGRELMLPAGTMTIVFRLGDEPVRIFDDLADPSGRTFGLAVAGGARASAYVRDVARPTAVVGAELHPGAADLLLGAPADELANAHRPLSDLWGAAAAATRDRLLEAGGLSAQVDTLEAVLSARLSAVRHIHPAVALALTRFATATPVRAVVRESGYSHRRFITLFRQAVGLNPKVYTRLVRFGRVLEQIARRPGASWAEVALIAGYSDQSHLVREFRELAGVSPGRYRAAAPAQPRHVPLG